MSQQIKKYFKSDIFRTGSLLAGFAIILAIILGIVYEMTSSPIAKAEQELEERAKRNVFPNKYILNKGKAYDVFYLALKEYIEKETPQSDVAKRIIDLDNQFKILREKDSIEFIVMKNTTSNKINAKSSPLILTEKLFKVLSVQIKNNQQKIDEIIYKYSNQPIYILEKGKSFNIYNETVKPANFNNLSSRNYIEFITTKKGEIAQISELPLLNEKQTKTLIKSLAKDKIKLISYYNVYSDSKETPNKANIEGWIVKFVASGGYSGNIEMLIGIDRDRKIRGYTMLSHSETPGLGALANNSNFIQAFVGKDPLKMPLNKKNYKQELEIDSISGATITSIAVTKGIKVAYEKLNVRIKDLDIEKPIEVQKNDVQKKPIDTNESKEVSKKEEIQKPTPEKKPDQTKETTEKPKPVETIKKEETKPKIPQETKPIEPPILKLPVHEKIPDPKKEEDKALEGQFFKSGSK